MVKVYIGLGGNLSDPVTQLKIALETLDNLEQVSLVSCSRFYGSKPLGPEDQPDFVNAVCEIETSLSAEKLLLILQNIELEQGRIKKRHWGERLIDLDILLYGDEIIHSEFLTVPHAEMAQRDFVLIPLAEIAPNLSVPNLGLLDDLIQKLSESYLKPII